MPYLAGISPKTFDRSSAQSQSIISSSVRDRNSTLPHRTGELLLTVSSLPHVFDGVFQLDETFLVGVQSLKNKRERKID